MINRIRQVPVWLLILGCLLLIGTVLWAPRGLKTTGLVEDWSFYQAFDQGLSPFNQGITGQPTRPFLLLSYALGYWLTPNSFVGLNLVSIVFFACKGFFLYTLLRQLLPSNRLFAMVAAFLLVIYPSDTSLVTSRYASYQLMVVFFLLSLNFFVWYWRRPHRLILFGMGVFQLLCLGTYETALPIFFVVPLILIWLQKSITRRVLRVAAFWYVIPSVILPWMVIMLSKGGSYQSAVLNADASLSMGDRLSSYWVNFIRAYTRNFFEGWSQAFSTVQWGTRSIWIGLAAAVVIAIVLFIGLRRTSPDDNDQPVKMIDYLLLFVAGCAIIGLGFLLYLPLPHRTFNDRVFLLSSIGAVVSVVSFLFLIGRVLRRPHLIVALASIAMVVGGVVSSYKQRLEMVALSQTEQRVLADFVRNVPSYSSESIILVNDRQKLLQSNGWLFAGGTTSGHFAAALNYLYQRPNLVVVLCYPEENLWGENREGCQFTEYGASIYLSGKILKSYPYDRLIVLNEDAETGLQLAETFPTNLSTASAVSTYNPHNLIDTSAELPHRVYTLLESWPFKMSAPYYDSVQQAVDFHFQETPNGYGWDGSEGDGSWMSSKHATINVLLGAEHDYDVTLRATAAVERDLLSTVGLRVNGQPIPLTITQEDARGYWLYRGLIPASTIAIDKQNTEFMFMIDQVYVPKDMGLSTDPRSLGVFFNWLQVIPHVEVIIPTRVTFQAVDFQFNQKPNGIGWNSPEPTGTWMSDNHATINESLVTDRDYDITFRALNEVKAGQLSTMGLRVNGQQIPLIITHDGQGAWLYHGIITASAVALDKNNTELMFTIDHVYVPKTLGANEDTRSLGVFFNLLQITPHTGDIPPNFTIQTVDFHFDQKPNGIGWGNLEPAGMWMAAKQATLSFPLTPNLAYKVRFHIVNALKPELLTQLRLQVNDQPIALTMTQDTQGYHVYEGTLPASVINVNPDITQFAFSVDRTYTPQELGMNADTRSLALDFNWLKITPQ